MAKWRYPLTLLGLFLAVWTICAIRPLFPKDWLLENMLVFVSVPILVLTARWLRFSDFTYTCLFVFFCLHVIGSHYTYAEVPYERWFNWLTGGSIQAFFGFERNHFDRLVHFLYGLLITPSAVEIFAHYGRYPRSWAFLFPFLFISSHGGIYEMIEWGAALFFGGDLGQAYLGTQGDIWDGQKDMLLASAGALVTMLAYAALGRLPVRRG